MNPFDFVNSITFNKENLFEDPQAQKDYVPFIINRQLSYFADTVMHANLVNQYHSMPKQWQYDFLRLSIPKRKRYAKWHKSDTVTEDLIAVQKYYKYSEARALEALTLLTRGQIEEIKQQMDTGGKA